MHKLFLTQFISLKQLDAQDSDETHFPRLKQLMFIKNIATTQKQNANQSQMQ